jgi:hypothetical protein
MDRCWKNKQIPVAVMPMVELLFGIRVAGTSNITGL